jgi:hypothetical protein
MRQFTANELVALARCFDLPVLYFLLPPTDGADGLAAPDAPAKGWPWEYLLLLVWGHRNNFPIVAERAAPWAHASTVVTVPVDDVLDGTPDTGLLAQLTRDRERYTQKTCSPSPSTASPGDACAALFHPATTSRPSPPVCGDSPTRSTPSATTAPGSSSPSTTSSRSPTPTGLTGDT